MKVQARIKVASNPEFLEVQAMLFSLGYSWRTGQGVFKSGFKDGFKPRWICTYEQGSALGMIDFDIPDRVFKSVLEGSTEATIQDLRDLIKMPVPA